MARAVLVEGSGLMDVSRVIGFTSVVVVGAIAVATTAIPAVSQTPDQPKTFTLEQREQLRPLFTLVEEVAAGLPAPSDVALTWQHHFVKAVAGVVLVPFTLRIQADRFTSFPLAMYLRVVVRGAPAPAPGPRDPLAQYPFEDAAFFDEPADGRISRAFVAPPGDYDVYVALQERPLAGGPPPRTVVFKQPLGVPDLTTGLATSSIIVAEHVEVDPRNRRPSFEEQLDEPYTMWGTKITPALRTTFSRRDTLSVIFVVYNTGVAAADKPNVEIQYRFHQRTGVMQKTGVTEAFFGKTDAQSFNAGTLGSEFSLGAGDLIVAGQDVPLARFPAGDYRLEITITDRTDGAWLARSVLFTVADP